MKEVIYALEPLAYYFNIKPNEFWNATYREISLYCQSNLIKLTDDFKINISLFEAVTDKMIIADPMNKKSKITRLKDVFKKLFKEEKKLQTISEQIKLLRNIDKN